MSYRGRLNGDCGDTVVIHGVAYEMVWHCHRDAPPLCPLWNTRPDMVLQTWGFGWEDTGRGKHTRGKSQ